MTTAQATDERELARLLGRRLASRLQGLYSVGAGIASAPGFAPGFLPPRLEELVATARVLASLVPPGASAGGARIGEELCRHLSDFRDQMLTLSQSAAAVGRSYEATLVALEAFLKLFLVEITFTREKEVGREITQALVAAS